MSDRTKVLYMQANERDGSTVEMFMDGESGTWRLFVENPDNPDGQCVDFSLNRLRLFRDELSRVLMDIERSPDEFNAEVRKTWEDA